MSYLIKSSSLHHYQTRNSANKDFSLPLVSTEFKSKSIIFQGSNIWSTIDKKCDIEPRNVNLFSHFLEILNIDVSTFEMNFICSLTLHGSPNLQHIVKRLNLEVSIECIKSSKPGPATGGSGAMAQSSFIYASASEALAGKKVHSQEFLQAHFCIGFYLPLLYNSHAFFKYLSWY